MNVSNEELDLEERIKAAENRSESLESHVSELKKITTDINGEVDATKRELAEMLQAQKRWWRTSHRNWMRRSKN